MKVNKWLLCSAGATLLIPAIKADAIEVFPIVKEISQETPRENYISVKSGSRPAENEELSPVDSQRYEFVTLELFHITNPGDSNEKRVKESGKADPDLIFSPTKLVVPYSEHRKVRLLPLKEIKVEKVYRLRVRPSYPEQEMDKGKIRFAVGYDVLVRYLPSGSHVQAISLSCEGNQWTISATGNVRSELRDLVVDGRKDQKIFNIYPEYARSVSVNKRLVFEFEGKQQTYEACQRKV
ncbi:hypothetical protein [Erwinia sp.]|uniref:hypothetical protein n=1 Tax=Erwinia citreus TaxID=558 RepID=UPI003C7520D7